METLHLQYWNGCDCPFPIHKHAQRRTRNLVRIRVIQFWSIPANSYASRAQWMWMHVRETVEDRWRMIRQTAPSIGIRCLGWFRLVHDRVASRTSQECIHEYQPISHGYLVIWFKYIQIGVASNQVFNYLIWMFSYQIVYDQYNLCWLKYSLCAERVNCTYN